MLRLRLLISFARTALVVAALYFVGLEIGARLLDSTPVLTTTNFVASDLDRTFNFAANIKCLYMMHESGTIYGYLSNEGNRVITSMISDELRKSLP